MWVLFGSCLLLLLLMAALAIILIRYLPVIVKLFLNTEIPVPNGNGQKIRGETVQFLTEDGVPLTGIFMPGKNGDGRTVIFCHEYGSDMHSASRFAGFLPMLGINLFTFDFRGHGSSSNSDGYIPRQWVTDREVRDFMAAIRYVRQRKDVDRRRIGVFGISRGAGACICATPQLRGVRAIVADGVFSTRLTMERYMTKWVSIFAVLPIIYNNLPDWFYSGVGYLARFLAELKLHCRFPPVERNLSRLPSPIYMIYGERDTYVGAEQANNLFQATAEPKELWMVTRAKHNEAALVANEEYTKRVAQFLVKHL